MPSLAYGYAIIALHDDAARLLNEHGTWARDCRIRVDNRVLVALANRNEKTRSTGSAQP